MKIVQAFPCRCRFADKENAPKVEEEVNFLHEEMFCWHKTYRQSCVFYASLYFQCSHKEEEQWELQKNYIIPQIDVFMIYSTLPLYSVPYNAAEAKQACP